MEPTFKNNVTELEDLLSVCCTIPVGDELPQSGTIEEVMLCTMHNHTGIPVEELDATLMNINK